MTQLPTPRPRASREIPKKDERDAVEDVGRRSGPNVALANEEDHGRIGQAQEGETNPQVKAKSFTECLSL